VKSLAHSSTWISTQHPSHLPLPPPLTPTQPPSHPPSHLQAMHLTTRLQALAAELGVSQHVLQQLPPKPQPRFLRLLLPLALSNTLSASPSPFCSSPLTPQPHPSCRCEFEYGGRDCQPRRQVAGRQGGAELGVQLAAQQLQLLGLCEGSAALSSVSRWRVGRGRVMQVGFLRNRSDKQARIKRSRNNAQSKSLAQPATSTRAFFATAPPPDPNQHHPSISPGRQLQSQTSPSPPPDCTPAAAAAAPARTTPAAAALLPPASRAAMRRQCASRGCGMRGAAHLGQRS